MSNQDSTQKQVVIVQSQKSLGLTIILTILFGPLGMLYSTITGGIVMIIASLLVAIITFGLGLIITWPICIIWAAIATNDYNKKLAGR
ncbi:MAG: hypothetical protein SFU87_18225 [Chitinophagaceae bacterium]|nr:hypothetical protein [Chitinophagaceae bacterium]